jgi:hypothetical protein
VGCADGWLMLCLVVVASALSFPLQTPFTV